MLYLSAKILSFFLLIIILFIGCHDNNNKNSNKRRHNNLFFIKHFSKQSSKALRKLQAETCNTTHSKYSSVTLNKSNEGRTFISVRRETDLRDEQVHLKIENNKQKEIVVKII